MATNLSNQIKNCGQAPPPPIWQKGYLTMSKNKTFHYRVDFESENIEISKKTESTIVKDNVIFGHENQNHNDSQENTESIETLEKNKAAFAKLSTETKKLLKALFDVNY